MDFKLVELEKYYDPLSVYSLFKDNLDSIFLDSARSDEKLSKYSFIGINPLCRYKCIEGKSYINNKLVAIDNPFNVINDLVNKNKFEYNSDIPLLSGAIGYFSYDISKNLEEIKSSSKEDFSIPEAVFIVYQNIIIFDIKNKNTIITSTNGEESINLIKDKLKEYTFKGDIPIPKGNNKFFSNFNKSEYENAVNKLKSYIEEGHVYIANLTRRIWCYNNEEAFKIYEKLRSINGAPFSCYMNLEEFSFISSSPERFLQVKNNIVETRPIKGTRPRGKNKAEDKKYKTELINSEKDKSELLMIVDLQRNDLSKVCKINSVKVDELYKIEEYETVFHLVSNIVGDLEEKYSSVDCMKACFPGGSITGAPKIRAMEIIDELEGLKRNIYTGSVGYFDFRGNCDFNIVIRSIIKKDNKAYFGVGSGITWDSDPQMEWFETIQKGKGINAGVIMRDIIYNNEKINIDSGILFGKGVFETINWQDGPILLSEHIDRLNNGLKILGLEKVCKTLLVKALSLRNYNNEAVKITVTDKNIIISNRPITYKNQDYKKGFKLNISKVKRNSTSKLTYIKSICYIENIIEKELAIKEGFNDCLFLNEKDYITETSAANIFFVDNKNNIVTPKVQDGLLNGIIREWIIENNNVIEKSINIKDISNYKEAFLTNSLMGIMKVTSINDIKFTCDYVLKLQEEYENAKGILGGKCKW